MIFQKILPKLIPGNLFLIDSIGALIPSILLLYVLPHFEKVIGVPLNVLILLGSVAIVLFIYSFLCFYFLPQNWCVFMKIVAIANLLYCLLTAYLVAYLFEKLTALGITYFVCEICLIALLAFLELSVSKTLK